MRSFLFVFSLLMVSQAGAQEERLDSLPGYQPTIMVIPFAKEGEDWRTVLERDRIILSAVTSVREGFQQAGYSTVDLRAKLRQLANDATFEWNNQTSVKQAVIERSGADIYVEVEPIVRQSVSGNAGGVILSAYDVVSGRSLANHTAYSAVFQTRQYERLVGKAVEQGLPAFIPQMTTAFQDVLMAGQVLALNVTLANSATYDLDSEVPNGDLYLGDVIANWLDENTLQGQYHLQGMTATKLIVDQLRVPFLDPRNGRPYRAYRFAIQLRNFLRGLGYESERDVQGNKIFITLL